jgi:Ran GTPase-activating protein (RanGAP) involved in mRNA processing and transport
MKLVAEMLMHNRSIEAIDFSGNLFGDRGAIYLAEALKVNQSLKMLSMWNYYVEPAGLKIGAKGAKAIGD